MSAPAGSDLVDLLHNRTPAGCEALARRLTGALDAEFAAVRATGAAIACAADCTFCCHQRVSVFPYEAVALHHHLHTKLPPAKAAAIEQRILANAHQIDSLTADEHRTANIPCAFLQDGLCSVYAVRPQACAAYHSMSRRHCEHAFQNPQDMGTAKNARPVLLELREFSARQDTETRASLASAGLPAEKGELHQLVRRVVEAG